MISREKVLEILKGLERKVADRQVRWNIDDSVVAISQFWLAFPTSTLYLRYDSPIAEFDCVEIEIQNADGLTVASVRVDEEDQDWPWVKGLFDEVERQVTGSDRILEEIEGAIRSGGMIGVQ